MSLWRRWRGPDPPDTLHDARHARRAARPRRRNDRGSSTVEFVIAAAAMVLLLLMVVQIGVWYHTRAVAQTAARHGLDHVRTLDGSTGDGITVANEFLAQSGGGLEGAQVDATRTAVESTVTVSGRVVSILPGVTFTVSVTVNAPTERIEP
jgi:Flp pilus assembly protein TadG